MTRQLLAAVLSACCIAAISPSVQSQVTAAARVQAITLEFTVLELSGARVEDFEKIEGTSGQLKSLMNEGKAKVIAHLRVRTRLGDNFSVAVGQRGPIQTAVITHFPSTEQSRRDAREPTQLQAGTVGFPQMIYENTGLSVEGVASSPDDGKFDIRLKVEISAFDTSTGKLTPTIANHRLAEMVKMKGGETVIVMGLIQQDPPWASPAQDATGAASLSRGSFVLLLSAKPIQ